MPARSGGAQRSAERTAGHLTLLPDAPVRTLDVAPYVARLRSVELGERPSARDLIRHAVRGSAVALLTWLPVAEVGDDPEGVHCSRVALRRLRSDLRTFDELLVADRITPLIDEIRWLADVLGAIRDLDVLEELLRASVDRLDDRTVHDALPVLITVLDRQRDRARSTLRDALAHPRTASLLDALVDVAADPPTTLDAVGRARARLRAPVRRRWRRLRRTIDRLPDRPSIAQLHRVRILAKRARYAAEAVDAVSDRSIGRFAKAAAGVQTELGHLRDAELAAEWLRSAATGLDAEIAFVAGRIAQHIGERATVHGDDVDAALRRVRARAEAAGLD